MPNKKQTNYFLKLNYTLMACSINVCMEVFMSNVGSASALGCAIVFTIGLLLLMTSSSYAGHRGHHGGHRHVHSGGHGIHHGAYRGVHRGVHKNVYRHGRYYGGYRNYGFGSVGIGGAVVNTNCRWIRAHYNSAGYYIPARRVCGRY